MPRRRWVSATIRPRSATWALADKLGGDALIDIIRRDTHTCYNGDRAHFHDWGYGCGTCPACMLRAAGYQRYLSHNSA